MAKTCRTCNEIVMQPRCPYQGRAFYHDREYCVDWSKRETPLLVDELAAALRTIRNEDRLCELVAEGRDNFNESMLVLLDRIFPNIEPALARHQEEVGDARA